MPNAKWRSAIRWIGSRTLPKMAACTISWNSVAARSWRASLYSESAELRRRAACALGPRDERGLLRVGALVNIGRGRVAVKDETYTLWRKKGMPPLANFVARPDSDSTGAPDALARLWAGYTLAPNQLKNSIQYLETNTGDEHA